MTFEQICIGDLGRVVTGDTPPKSNAAYYGSAYPFIKPTDMKVGVRYTRVVEDGYSQEAFEKYRKKLVPPGSTAVVTIGSIGQKLTMIETPSFVNQAVNAVIPNREKFDPLYVYYLLRHNLHLIKSADTGASSGRENVSKSNFASLPIVVTKNKMVQERIGSILGGYDDLIENNQRRIALLEESARLLFREWFVNMRFPGNEQAQLIDGVPKTWSQHKLAYVIDAIGGATPTTARPDFWDGDVVWLTPTDVTRNDCLYLPTSARKITEAGYGSCSTTLLPAGTIFMTSRASIGYFALLDQPACTNQGFIGVVPKLKNSRNFLLFHLMSRVDEFEAKATGTTFKELSKRVFRDLTVLVPQSDVMSAFEAAVQPIIDQIFNLKKQTIRMIDSRDALLPKMMSGDLTV